MTESNTPRIESQDLSVGALFKDFYSVPDFQREYVWQREQVEGLLQDLYEEFYDEEGRILSGPEYFLGSIVACKSDDGTFSRWTDRRETTPPYSETLSRLASRRRQREPRAREASARASLD